MSAMRLVDVNKLSVCHINVGTVMFPRMEAFVRAADIEAAPVVDAAPVVHAEWLPIDVDANAGPLFGSIKVRMFLCSACKTHREENSAVKPGYRYCPDCGAKMDLEEG